MRWKSGRGKVRGVSMAQYGMFLESFFTFPFTRNRERKTQKSEMTPG